MATCAFHPIMHHYRYQLQSSEWEDIKPVEDECWESFTVDVLSNDDERLALTVGEFQRRNHRLYARDLLLTEQNQSVLELTLGSWNTHTPRVTTERPGTHTWHLKHTHHVSWQSVLELTLDTWNTHTTCHDRASWNSHLAPETHTHHVSWQSGETERAYSNFGASQICYLLRHLPPTDSHGTQLLFNISPCTGGEISLSTGEYHI